MRTASIRRSLRHAAPAPALRHRAFLDRLRRGRRDAPLDAVSRILRLTRPWVRAWRSNVRLCIDVRPLAVVHSPALVLRPGAERRVEHVQTLHKLHSIERLLRDHRIERVRTSIAVGSLPAVPRQVAAAAPPVRRAWQEQTFPRLAMPTVRSPAAAPARPEPTSPSPLRTDTAARAPAPWTAAAALVLPADELSRVTDHVLRTLDRRVLSYRERTGQV